MIFDSNYSVLKMNLFRLRVAKVNWWGISSVVVLLLWFLNWHGIDEPYTLAQKVLFWGPFVAIHVLAIIAFKRSRNGWIYLIPVAFIWLLPLVSILGVTVLIAS